MVHVRVSEKEIAKFRARIESMQELQIRRPTLIQSILFSTAHSSQFMQLRWAPLNSCDLHAPLRNFTTTTTNNICNTRRVHMIIKHTHTHTDSITISYFAEREHARQQIEPHHIFSENHVTTNNTQEPSTILNNFSLQHTHTHRFYIICEFVANAVLHQNTTIVSISLFHVCVCVCCVWFVLYYSYNDYIVTKLDTK